MFFFFVRFVFSYFVVAKQLTYRCAKPLLSYIYDAIIQKMLHLTYALY